MTFFKTTLLVVTSSLACGFSGGLLRRLISASARECQYAGSATSIADGCSASTVWGLGALKAPIQTDCA